MMSTTMTASEFFKGGLVDEGIYRFEDSEWETLHKGQNLTAITFLPNKISIGTTNGFYAIDLFNGKKIQEIYSKLPVPVITDIHQVGTQLWFASNDGAFLKEADRYRYFAGGRWLDQNNVIDIASNSKGDLYFLTSTGLNKVKYITQTLADKTTKIQDDIRKYHMRFGWVNEIRYSTPGDLKSANSADNDNDLM